MTFPPDTTTLREEINTTSARMALLADAGEWEEAAELIDQRSRLIEALLADPSRVTLEEVALIRSVLEGDRSLLQLATSSRSAVIEKLDTLRKGSKAVRAYAQNA